MLENTVYKNKPQISNRISSHQIQNIIINKTYTSDSTAMSGSPNQLYKSEITIMKLKQGIEKNYNSSTVVQWMSTEVIT